MKTWLQKATVPNSRVKSTYHFDATREPHCCSKSIDVIQSPIAPPYQGRRSQDQAMSSITSTSKERHYAHLASQLQTLSSNMINAQNNIAAAAEQAKYIRNLGAGQASM
jgi:hypothetical protein